MSFLFKKPSAPAPVYLSAPTPAPVAASPVPASPTASTSPAAAAAPATAADAQAARDSAAKASVADAAANGRSSTIVAGMQIAAEKQQSRGLMSAKKRQAAQELGQ